MKLIESVSSEVIIPANPLDQFLASSFVEGDASKIDRVGNTFPTETLQFLKMAISGRVSVDAYLKLMTTLEQNGLTATAISAADTALTAIANTGRPDLQAELFWMRSAIEARLGLPWRANSSRRMGDRLAGRINYEENLPVVSSDKFAIIDAWNRPEEYSSLAEKFNSPLLLEDPLRDPIGTKSMRFSGVSSPLWGAFADFSFFVVGEDGLPILQIECDTSSYCMPIRCREAPVVVVPVTENRSLIGPAASLAFEQLLAVSSWSGTCGVMLEIDRGSEVGNLLAELISRETRKEVRTRMLRGGVTLARGEKEIFSSYCENHRRSIGKGAKHLTIVEHDSPTKEALNCYDVLHRRIDRPRALTDTDLSELLTRRGYRIHVAYRDNQVVGFVGISRHGRSAYYSAGIMAGPDNIPIGHILMHQAIISAKSAGLEVFDFGLLDIANDASPKMRSIARFKLGFCNHITEKEIVTIQASCD